MFKLGPFTANEAAHERSRLLTVVPVLALVPKKMLANNSQMCDQEWFDLVQFAAVKQQFEHVSKKVLVTIIDGCANFSWPFGYGGLDEELILDKNQNYHVWMEFVLEIGTASQHARFAACCAVGIEIDGNGSITLLPDFCHAPN